MTTKCVEKPCNECPYRKNGPTGWHGYTGSEPPESYAASIIADERVPCHMTIDYEDPNWHSKWVKGQTGQFCAGAIIMTANIVKSSRDRDRPVLRADKVAVYPNLGEMVEAHRASSHHSWDTERDHDEDVTIIRQHLRLPPLK